MKLRWLVSGLTVVGLLVLTAGCGRSEATRTGPVYLPIATVGSAGSYDGRYAGSEDRLVFPTATPEATVSPRPTRVPRELLSLLTPVVKAVAEDAASPGKEDEEELSCLDRYRRMLIGYDGRSPFGFEVAYRLSGEMVNAHPECGVEGWSPKFGLSRVCLNTKVGGMLISREFLRPEGRVNVPMTRSSGRDSEGNIFLHFQKLPLNDEAGCWYYDAEKQAWGWSILGVGSGIDRPVFPACELRLREVLAGSESPAMGPLEVVRGIDEVKGERSLGCDVGLWEVYPQREGRDGCLVVAPTGRWGDGLVINWLPEHPASGGAVCWVLQDGEWTESYLEGVE